MYEHEASKKAYTSELQQRLLLDGVSSPHLLPSQRAIKKCVREATTEGGIVSRKHQL